MSAMKPTLPFLFLTASLAAAGACSQQETATPNTTPITTSATTGPSTTLAVETTVPPTVAAETSTTIESTTTVAETTTTAPPTTALPAPSGEPTGEAVPIFAGSDLGPWLYLGRWSGSAWDGAFDAENQAVDPAFASNATITITDLTRGARDGASGASGESCFDGRTGPAITPNAGVPDPPGFGYSAIALPADWPLRPRPVAEVEADIADYRESGIAAFAGDAVETQAGELDQIVVSDLDGDGDSEAIVVFGDESESESAATDPGFSALLLIDTDSGDATTIAKSFVPLDLEEGALADFESHRVLDVADLNGDGLMEIVAHVWYGEGALVSIFTYDGGAVTEVLSTGCGS